MKRALGFLIIIGLLLALSFPTTVSAQDIPTPEPVGLRPDAPTYALHGPYWVGARDFVIEDADRTTPLTVWYPALNPQGSPEDLTYTDIMVKFDAPLPAGELPTLRGHALKDAQANMTGSPYPLILFSHGYGDWRTEYAYLTEHLASYGFVVIAPDHTEFWTPEVPDLWSDTILRFQDMQRVIAYVETLTATGADLAGLIDMQRIGIAGHSLGGTTALATTGARFSLDEFNARCAAIPADDPNQGYCSPYVSKEGDMAALAGLDPVPTGLWPSWGDARIKAVASFAGDSYLFGESGLAAITAPLLVVGGTNDSSTALQWGIYPTYAHTGSAQKAQVVFENADHFIFGAQCPDDPWLNDIGFSMFCSDSVWDSNRAHDLINHFTTAFLLDVLKGDTDAAAALAPDAVSFPGIQYQAQGF